MRILFLTHSFNSLAQRLFVELRAEGHEVSVEFDINDVTSIDAVERFDPELIIAPFLKRAIPAAIWRSRTCFIVHPGIVGDRGPSALDWAILNDEPEWGVTVLQANADMDAGDVWATETFLMRRASKSSLYRNEITEACVRAVRRAISRFASGSFQPRPVDQRDPAVLGRERPLLRAADRRIDWQTDDTQTVLRKIRSADGFPGALDEHFGRRLYLYDAWEAPMLVGEPGEWVATSGHAIGIATRDGGVWIGSLREPAGIHPFKRRAVEVMGTADRPNYDVPTDEPGAYPLVRYEEQDDVGYLHFAFYNGAMGTADCRALLAAYQQALTRDTRVIVLCGGPEFWSNGMDLNAIEAADSPADASWDNINAIDDLAEAIIRTRSHLTVAALHGNAGAGGVFLARAADQVWSHDGIVLNPHYKDMGNLYGSEFWTYLLPRACGDDNAQRITQSRLPIGGSEAVELGLVDALLAADRDSFFEVMKQRARALARSGDFDRGLDRKHRRRDTDESEKPLSAYRDEELERMRMNFYGFDPSYHVARYNFVCKVPRSRTPMTIALHRRVDASRPMRDAS